MSSSNKRRTSTNPVEVLSCFWLEVGSEHKMVRTGMCCKFEGYKGLYRILGLRYHKAADQIVLLVRKELRHGIGKMQERDAEDMIWVEPPYNVPV